MSEPRRHAEAGLTLLEVLIGMSLFLIALAAVTMAFDSNRRSYVRGEARMEIQQQARLALSEMTRELRMAGYFPENFAEPAADPPVARAIQIATDRELAFHGDPDGTGASNVFLYCLDGTVLRRAKGPDGDASAYWCPAGEVLAENVTDLRFNYFDANDLPIPSPPTRPYALDDQTAGSEPTYTDVVERTAVRRVVVSLTVREDVPGLAPQVFSLGSEVELRNVH